MAASTATAPTLTLPETVEIPGAIAFEALVLLHAFAEMTARVTGREIESLDEFTNDVYEALYSALDRHILDNETDELMSERIYADGEILAGLFTSWLQTDATRLTEAEKESSLIRQQLDELGERVIGVKWNGVYWESRPKSSPDA